MPLKFKAFQIQETYLALGISGLNRALVIFFFFEAKETELLTRFLAFWLRSNVGSHSLGSEWNVALLHFFFEKLRVSVFLHLVPGAA